jgi:hypothetical protein
LSKTSGASVFVVALLHDPLPHRDYCRRRWHAAAIGRGATPRSALCSACRKKFSVTSGTIFHSRKLAIRDYLAVIALFCNGVKGTSALQMSRDMNINPKSAFVLLHKLREAMGAEIAAGSELAGEVEVDGAFLERAPVPRTGRRIAGNSAMRAASNRSSLSPASVSATRGHGLSARKPMPFRKCATPSRADQLCMRTKRMPGTSCMPRS